MNKILSFVFLLFVSFGAYSQKVYVTDKPYEADYKVLVVPYVYSANWLVYKCTNEYESKVSGNWYFVKYKYQADIVICYVKYDYQSNVKVWFVDHPYQVKIK